MKSKSFLKEILIFLAVGLLINLFCFFIYFVPVHAENNPYFPMGQNENNTLPSQLETILNSNYSDVYGFVKYGGSSTSWNFYFVVFDDEPLHAELYNNGYQFSIYSSGSITEHRIVLKKSDNSLVEINRDGYHTGLNGLNSSVYDNTVSYLSNHNIFTANDEQLVLDYDWGGDISDPDTRLPHAVPPDFDNEHFFAHGSGVPQYPNNVNPPSSVPPSYTINNYTWTTVNPPPVDTSTLEDLVESGIEVMNYLFGWLSSNLSNEFANLTINIKGLFDYLGQTFQYYGDLIIGNIQNGIQNNYDNFKSLLEPIASAVNYMLEPLDATELSNALSNTSFYSLVTVGGSFKSTFQNYFDSIPQLDSLSFSIPYTILTKSGYIDIDFSWYSTIRDSIVPWIVGFLYAGFGLAIFRSIPSIIHGVSGVLQKGG